MLKVGAKMCQVHPKMAEDGTKGGFFLFARLKATKYM